MTFYYKADNGWQKTGWSNGRDGRWIPNWTSDPRLYIQGYDLYGLTSFSADNVEYAPIPEPSTMLLLSSGLLGLGLIGVRKKFRK